MNDVGGYIAIGFWLLLGFAGLAWFSDPNIRASYYTWAEKVTADWDTSCKYRAEPQGDGTYKLYRC